MEKIRVKKAFSNMLDNGGNLSRAMVDAGFSKGFAHNSHKLRKTKAWKDLESKYLPDNHVIKKHREMLDSKRQVRTFKRGDITVQTIETDPSAVKALDIAYKVKGRYHDATYNDNRQVIINVNGEKLKRLIARADGNSV